MAEFLLMPFGSAGDTFPFIGLGRHLQERGHVVRLAGNGYFRSHIRDAGLQFDELWSKQDYLDTMANPDIWHPTKGFGAVVGHSKMPIYVEEQHQYIIEQFVRNPNIVVVAGSLAFGARIARETHGLKLATVHMSPSVFLSVKKPPRLPNLNIPRWWPRWMVQTFFWVGNRLVIQPVMKRVVGGYRKELGLPKLGNYFREWIHSQELVLGLWPEWFAEKVADWPASTKLMNFPFFDSTNTNPLNPDIHVFLKEGTPPVVMTFGSAMKQGAALFQATVDACQALNQRAILLTPFAEQTPVLLPPTMRRYDYLPLSKLLPYASAVVHHGGIGTTAQGFRAGVPQVITPLAHDQFDNAARAEGLGVSVTLPAAKVDVARMTKALKRVLENHSMREQAMTLSQQFAGAEPFAQIANELEELVRRHPSTKYWV